MTNITLDDLKAFRGLSSELEALKIEMQWFYYPVSSPNGRVNEGRSNVPSDPTSAAVRRISEMEERIVKKKAIIAEKVVRILDWMDHVEDAEIRAMIHWYYVIGVDDWEDVNMKVYGYRGQACRKRVMRYFGYEK